jgi:hypothetical protein
MKLPMDGGGFTEGEFVQSDGGGLQFIEGHGVPLDQQQKENMSTEETKASIKLHKTKTPRIGDHVLYVLSDTDGSRSKGEIRPAIITRVWDDPASRDSVVQMQVFTDGQNDGLQNVEWRTSVHQDFEKSPGTFHYML